MSAPNDLNDGAIEARVERLPWSGCWIWTAVILGNGYGQYQSRGRRISAHRASYAVFVGPVPDGLFVCHKCDVRSCVNPAHLFLGTPKENSADMVSKNRVRTPRGEANGHSKLTENDIVAIRSDDKTDRALAAKYGVSSSVVNEIRNRKAWSHI